MRSCFCAGAMSCLCPLHSVQLILLAASARVARHPQHRDTDRRSALCLPRPRIAPRAPRSSAGLGPRPRFALILRRIRPCRASPPPRKPLREVFGRSVRPSAEGQDLAGLGSEVVLVLPHGRAGQRFARTLLAQLSCGVELGHHSSGDRSGDRRSS